MIRKPYSLPERISIEMLLNENYSIIDITKELNRKDSSGIIKEINKHIIYRFSSYFNGQHPCLKYNTCKVKELECYKDCKNIEIKICPKLTKSPHVCNGCNTKNGCRYVKKYYIASTAHNLYKEKLSNSRIGLRYTEYEITILNEILLPVILKSKSIYHSVLAVNQNFNLTFKTSTIYKQIERKQLSISISDLPRYRKETKTKIDKSYKRDLTDHTYEDYNNYKSINPNAIETQMDTVEGIKENNAPVFLTLEIVKINFLLIFKIDNQTKEKVLEKLSDLKDIIGKETIDKIMEILLTDNGKEFNIIEEIKSISSNVNIFYCHPYSSYEKGSIENNHELIRRVIPKGISLKPYTQKELDLLCSHINSLYREKLNGKCPFDLIEEYIPKDKIDKLNLHKINPLKLELSPTLLGRKNIDNIKKHLDKNEIIKANLRLEEIDEEKMDITCLKY